ncbi:MAG TPA: molybdopterin-dependent oxidoreductase [Syntrophorhabdales bacterium]|nr:molybdopterin-dependent oxidoreductase [Syntrophorhabdales bacterium]
MNEKVVRSLCGFCHANCGIKAHIKDGRVSRVEGDPDHPVNKGYLCPKAQAIKPMLESKERLAYPRKKTKGGFSRITWDEAFDIAADRLAKIRESYGPESLVHCHGAPVTYGGRDGFLQFMGAYGSPNLTGAANLCHVPRRIAFMDAFGGRPEPDYEHTKLAIFWALNPVNTTRYSNYAAYDGFHQIPARLKERGARIIVVDPVHSESVPLADDWIRPNIGTDVALGLAMAHTIIAEGLYDEAFVKRWVAGFDDIRKHVELTSPEWAEKITSVSAGKIREIARFYAKADGATIVDGNGIDMHTAGVDMARAICLLIALTGNIEKEGGNVFFPFAAQAALPTIKLEKKSMGKEVFPLFPQVPFPFIKEALLKDAPGRPRAMVVHHANPVLVQANQNRTMQALQKLDFLMVLDIFPTGTTEMADLVLPAAADLEAVDYRAYSSSRGGFFALREKLVEPLGESKSVFEIEYELARRMGIEQSYPFKNAEEWINFAVKPAGVTLDDLRKNQIVYASSPMVYRKYEKDGFQTPSRMVQCYSERCKKANYGALPAFRSPEESLGDASASREYSLLGTTRRTAEYVHTKLVNLPTAGRIYPDPLLSIHPADAQKRGIQQDTPVELASPRGKIIVKAKITEDVGPGMIAVDFGWGNPTDNKPNINLLTSDSVWDPVSGGYPNRLFVCEATPA